MSIPQIGGLPVASSYIPHKYSPLLLEKYHDNTFLTKVTNRDYEGDFRESGDQITIRHRPDISTFRYRKGMTIPYQGLATGETVVTVDRARGWAFKVNKIDEKLTDLKGFVGQWTDEGAKALAEDNEAEFLADIFSRCDAANAGNTAGLRSSSYDLGSAITPLQVVNSGATSDHVANAPDAIAAAAAALSEQPGGMGDDPWIIIPVWMGLRIQTSELKNASDSGDDQSMLRKSIKALGKIAGFTVYQSNLVKVDTDGSNNKLYNVVFGDRAGITFAEQVSISEVKPNPFEPGDLHSSIMVYDWFPIQPTRFGHMVVTPG